MSDSAQRSGFYQFFAEMRRRRVGRFAIGYLASAFVVLQLAEIVFPAFGIGEDVLRTLVVVAVLGLPPALVLAWMYDISRGGITRTEGKPADPRLQAAAVGSLLVVTLVATGASGLYLARQGVFGPSADATASRSDTGVARAVAYDPSQPIGSIAVLPIKDHSPTGDQAYFAASMHEELIAKLSRIESIRVVSRTSTLQFADSVPAMPEVARRLGVDVVVEGSVIRTPQRTRVTLQLIHGPSDSHIETLQWDREQIDDVLAFQTEIAHEVVEAVLAQHDEETFTRLAGAVDPAAQDAYFRGRFEYDQGTPDGYLRAMRFFEEALTEDPDFAQAMAGMAGARFLGALEGSAFSETELLRAYDEAEAALALDSTSTETREVFALIERSLPGLLRDAPEPPESPAAASVRVLRLPGRQDSVVIDVDAFDTAWVAPITTFGGRIEERVRELSVVTDARDAPARALFEARPLFAMGRYDEAAGLLERAVRDGTAAPPTWDALVRAHVGRQDLQAARDAARRWAESTQGSGSAASASAARSLQAALADQGAAGYWSWRLEHLERQEAEGVEVPSFELASAHAALGNEDRALQYLVRALRDGEPGVMGIRTDPVWDDLRRNPRLREIVNQAQNLRFEPNRRSRTGTRGG